MKTFNIGIIGYGGFGKFLHHCWSQLSSVRVVAIADQNAQQITGLREVRTFVKWQDLIEVKEIDLIAIVTEPSSHEVIATACMHAGKHILIEKPLAITLAGALEIIDVRDKTGIIAGIDYVMRFNPLLQELRRLTQQHVFGKLRRVAVENYAQDQQLPPSHWFWDHARSGGILIEHAVHFIDLVHYLSPSDVTTVNGLKHDRNPKQEDQIMANVLYTDGLIATHYHAFVRPGFFETTSITLAYDLADIELHGWIPLKGEIKVLVNKESREILLSCPFFELGSIQSLDRINDESRPAGWGMNDNIDQSNRDTIQSGGVTYHVNEMVTGSFQLGRGKQEVYSSCIQASLLDVLQKIENPEHQLTAPLETGVSSLEVAIRATESARNNQ